MNTLIAATISALEAVRATCLEKIEQDIASEIPNNRSPL